MREVHNTVQLILAAEKYYHFKTAYYFDWTADDADNFDYTSSAHDDVEVEDKLNIILPRDVCEYWVDGSGTIHFQRAADNDPVGSYDMATDTYVIDDDYKKYLGYLEPPPAE